MLKRLVATCVLLVAITALDASQALAHTTDDTYAYRGILPDEYYDRVQLLETAGNWLHSTKSYTSLGINRGTFRTWSGKTSSRGMTRQQIVNIADRIAFVGWQSPTRFVWPVGPYGWAVVRSDSRLKAYICHSKDKRVIKRSRGC